MEYQNRYVAFLDVLGFKNLVNGSKDAPSYKVVRYFEAARECILKINRIASKEHIGSIVISDSVILTIEKPVDKSQSLKNLRELCIAIGIFQQDMAKEDIWIRGAIACGKTSFSNDPIQIVGPAYIKAYQLEESLANYPRVIIDTDIINILGFDSSKKFTDAINRKGSGAPPVNWGSTVVFDWFDRQDQILIKQDTPLFIDYMRNLIERNNFEEIKTIVSNIKNNLYGNSSVYQKHKWTVDYLHSLYYQEGYPYNPLAEKQLSEKSHSEIINTIRNL